MYYYRFSIDDNIRFLQELAHMGSASLFDHPYLALLRSLHGEFGAKIHLNLFYQTEGFCLAQMPDYYRAQWMDSSNWLRLSFHSRAEEPPSPYAEADAQTLWRDCQQVQREIVRFAGCASLSPYTTLHYTAATREGVLALRECGIKGLVGLFGSGDDVERSYHLPLSVCRYLKAHSFFHDADTQLDFIRNDLILNLLSVEEIPALLEQKRQQAFMEIMIHEQYFYPDYAAYQPDFAEKIRCALSWLTAHGYQSCFLEDLPFLPLQTETGQPC